MTTLNKSDLQKFSEQSGLQVDGRSEFAYTVIPPTCDGILFTTVNVNKSP